MSDSKLCTWPSGIHNFVERVCARCGETAPDRFSLNRWIVTDETGSELAMVTGATMADAKAEADDELETDGGYYLRRLSDDEYKDRQVHVDRNITPDLYY